MSNGVVTTIDSQAALATRAAPSAHHSTVLACSPRLGGVITSAMQPVSAIASRIENRCVPSVVAAGLTMAILSPAVTAALAPASAAAPAASRAAETACPVQRHAQHAAREAPPLHLTAYLRELRGHRRAPVPAGGL